MPPVSTIVARLGAALLLASTAGALIHAQGTPNKVHKATLILEDVNGTCTPEKPDVVLSRSQHSGLKWRVANFCNGDATVEVFDFAPVTTGDCTAPAGSKPFNEASRSQKGIKKEKLKAFDDDFTLGQGQEVGCWTYKVKVGANTFDPQVRIDR
jgi:hypothetical protein